MSRNDRGPSPWTRPARFALAAALVATLAAGAVRVPRVAAQTPLREGGVAPESVTVVLVGAADVALDRRLKRLLRGRPLIVMQNASVPASDTIRRSVLVLDATLVLEGVIEGDLVLVGHAGAFVRPGAVVRGDLVNIAGGLYRSELARVGGHIIDLPNAPYRVIREPERNRIVIESRATISPVRLDGFMGVHAPIYDRVNGVTAAWGARYRFPDAGPVTPALHAQAGWVTQRGDPQYEGDLSVRWAANRVTVGYERGWATNDAWIYGDLRNSLNYLWDAVDQRNYYGVTRGWARITREFGDAAKRFHGAISVAGQLENAASLAGGQPWNILGDSARPNPAIDDGRTSSVIGAGDFDWRGRVTAFQGQVGYEDARHWSDGDFSFGRAWIHGDWAMRALADHTLEIEFFTQLPVRGSPLPLQRWSFVGGRGTLQTLGTAAQRGDHVVFVEPRYIIPLPRSLTLPILGAPDFGLVYATGSAWAGDEDARFRQEIGAQLRFSFMYLRYMVEPTHLENGNLQVGLNWPLFGQPYPWEE